MQRCGEICGKVSLPNPTRLFDKNLSTELLCPHLSDYHSWRHNKSWGWQNQCKSMSNSRTLQYKRMSRSACWQSCSGGLEMLFSNQRNHKVTLPAHDPDGNAANVAFLIRYLCENLMTDQKKELFILDESVYVSSPSKLALCLRVQQTTWHPCTHQRCGLGARGWRSIWTSEQRQHCLCIYSTWRIDVFMNKLAPRGALSANRLLFLAGPWIRASKIWAVRSVFAWCSSQIRRFGKNRIRWSNFSLQESSMSKLLPGRHEPAGKMFIRSRLMSLHQAWNS